MSVESGIPKGRAVNGIGGGLAGGRPPVDEPALFILPSFFFPYSSLIVAFGFGIFYSFQAQLISLELGGRLIALTV